MAHSEWPSLDQFEPIVGEVDGKPGIVGFRDKRVLTLDPNDPPFSATKLKDVMAEVWHNKPAEFRRAVNASWALRSRRRASWQRKAWRFVRKTYSRLRYQWMRLAGREWIDAYPDRFASWLYAREWSGLATTDGVAPKLPWGAREGGCEPRGSHPDGDPEVAVACGLMQMYKKNDALQEPEVPRG